MTMRSNVTSTIKKTSEKKIEKVISEVPEEDFIGESEALISLPDSASFTTATMHPALKGSIILGPNVLRHLAKMKGRGKPTRGKAGKRGTKGYRSNGTHSIGFTFDRMIPSEFDVPMCYYYSVSNVGSSSAYYFNYQSNALYDPDPAVGGQSFQPFAEWSTLYEKYRVISYSWQVDFVNYTANEGLNCFVLNTNVSPGAFVPSSSFSAGFRSMNQYCAQGILGKDAGGRNHLKLRGHCPIAGITGSTSFLTDDSFAGTSSSNPTNVTWISVGIETVTGGNLANAGAMIILKIVAKARWYERQNQYNS